MVMSRDQNASTSHNTKTDYSSFERVEQFKHLQTTLTDQTSIQEEIKEQTEFRQCLLSFGTESFVFQCAIQIHEVQDTQNYNFDCCYAWV